MRRTTLAVLVASAVALLAPAVAQALNVYAATSLRNVFPALDKAPTYSFGGSNTLQLQIERGAPADVFASASPNEAQALFREGLCTRPVTFATNRLVLLVPNANPGNITLGLLAALRRAQPVDRDGGRADRRLHAPAAARGMRLSSILSTNTVSQESNVGEVAAKVALGSADAGFVYVHRRAGRRRTARR